MSEAEFEHSFQLVTHRVVVRTNSTELHDLVRFITNSCRQSTAITHDLRYDIIGVDGKVEVVSDLVREVARDPASALERLYTEMHGTVLAGLAADGWTRLHGGLVDVDGRRILITGASRAGKTTLCVRLLFDGVSVASDEYTVVRDGVAVAYPRRLHVRQRTADVVPELRSLLPSVPSFYDETAEDDRTVTYALDPRSAGCDWRSDLRAIDAVYYLHPKHEGRSTLSPAPKHRMAILLSGQSFTAATDGSRVIAEVSGVVAQAECYELEVGTPADTARLIRES